SDGAIEAVDTIKSAFPGAQVLGLNVREHSFDDALAHRLTAARQIGLDALPQDCVRCPVVKTCGGGYFPHRYGAPDGFRNRSVYCADLKKLIEHITSALRACRKPSASSST